MSRKLANFSHFISLTVSDLYSTNEWNRVYDNALTLVGLVEEHHYQSMIRQPRSKDDFLYYIFAVLRLLSCGYLFWLLPKGG